MKNLTKNTGLNLEEITILILAASFITALLAATLTNIFNSVYFFEYVNNYINQAKTLGLIAFLPIAIVTLFIAIAHAIENDKETGILLNKILILLSIVFWSYNTVIYITL